MKTPPRGYCVCLFEEPKRCPQFPRCGCYGLHVTNPRNVDEKTIAERAWQKPKLAPAPQQPCDVGLFSDDANQLDLIDKLRS